MDYASLTKDQMDEYTELLFTRLNNADEIRNWISYFLDLDIPMEVTTADSTSNPLDAIWQVYESFLHNKSSEEAPAGYVLMSCREGMKTVAVALIELLLLLHFELEIAHAAATETQSTVGLSYIHGFIGKVEPLMVHRGWINASQNKRTLSFDTPAQKKPYIKILICSPKGMNSLHSNVLFLDELDLADPAALKEGRNIVGHSKGVHGKTVYLSTRKYAFGNMAKIISKLDDLNYKLLSWNIIDVTEKCPPKRHLPNEPKITKYVGKNLPLKQISEIEFDFLSRPEQVKYDKLEKVHAGCGKCLLLPVCRTKLSEKDDSCVGGFYKPIVSVIQKFKENDPDTAEAQLMCWRPGSTGLVYARLNTVIDAPNSNVISVRAAFKILTGQDLPFVTEEMLLSIIKKQGHEINACVDFGFTHEATIGIGAMPFDELWALDQFSQPGLEFQEFLDVAIKYRDKYEPEKWWCDDARPEFIVTFNKNGMKSPKFKKDVIGGISALRSKIQDSTGGRKFKIIATENNKKLINALSMHKFQLDSLGEPTDKPDDENQIADIADGWRYFAQNRFPVKGVGKVRVSISEPKNQQEQIAQTRNNSYLQAVRDTVGVSLATRNTSEEAPKKKTGFYFKW